MQQTILELGNPLLRKKAAEVTDFSSPALKNLIDDMIETMMIHNGIGIAAPQIGHSLQVFIINSRPTAAYADAPLLEPRAIINPTIITKSETIIAGLEGCLSAYEIMGVVPRHQRIIASFQDQSGKTYQEKFEGFPAIIFQHEIDHLHGLFFFDRMSDLSTLIMRKEYMRQKSDV